MATTKNKLPLGVSEVKNRPGLYRLSVMISGQRYSEYYRPDEGLTQRQLQSTLQKAVDLFREKAERGSLRGQITDKTRFADAVEWFLDTAKMELRESTLNLAERTFSAYLTPVLGNIQLRAITTPMISKLLADLSERGGGVTVYIPLPSFIETVKAGSNGKVYPTAAEIGIGENTLCRVRAGKTVTGQTATRTAEFFNVSLDTAFECREETKPLKATFVNRISTQLSALFTALVKNEVLAKNPVLAATKPRVGEQERGAFLDNAQLPVFLRALDDLANDDVRVCLSLCLKLGLRSGEARALRWCDVDFHSAIIHVRHSAGETKKGLIIGEPKTKRSIRDLPANHVLGMLINHKNEQARRAAPMGSAWTDNDLICPNQSGGIMARSQPYSAVVGIVRKHNELPPKLHPHSLRHSFVSMLISQGVDVVHVASLAGDTVEVISKVYAHALKEYEARAMDKIGAAFQQIADTAAPPKLLSRA
jgi:integrase